MPPGILLKYFLIKKWTLINKIFEKKKKKIIKKNPRNFRPWIREIALLQCGSLSRTVRVHCVRVELYRVVRANWGEDYYNLDTAPDDQTKVGAHTLLYLYAIL